MRTAVALLLASLVSSPALRADDAEALFEEALYLEQMKGDLPAARTRYERIEREATGPLAARARLRVAACLEKEGRLEEAIAVLGRILTEDADQLAVVRLAHERIRRHRERAELRVQVADEIRRFGEARDELVGQLGALQEKYRATLDDLAASKDSRERLAAELARKEAELRTRIDDLEHEIARRSEAAPEEAPGAIEERARRALEALAQMERVRQEQKQRILADAVRAAEGLLADGRAEEACLKIDEAFRVDPNNADLWRLMAVAQSRIDASASLPASGRSILRIHDIRAVREAFERPLGGLGATSDARGEAAPASVGIEEIGLWREDFEAWLVHSVAGGVRPARWQDPAQEIRVHLDTLLVRAERDVHEEVARYLDGLRTSLPSLLAIEVRVLFFGRGFLEEATREWDLPGAGGESGFTPTGTVHRIVLDPEQEAALLGRAASSAKARLLSAAPLPLVEGQAGSVSFLAHTVAVVGHELRRQGEHEVAQPLVERLAEGLVFHVQRQDGDESRLRGTATATRLVKPLAGVVTRAGTTQIASYLADRSSFELPLLEDRVQLLVGLPNPLESGESTDARRGHALPHLALLVSMRRIEPGDAAPPATAPANPPADLRTYSAVDLVAAGEEESGRLAFEGPLQDLAAAVAELAGGSATIHAAGDALAVEGPAESHRDTARFLNALRIHRADLVHLRVRAFVLDPADHDAALPAGDETPETQPPAAVVAPDEAEALFRAWRASERTALLPATSIVAANGSLARIERVAAERYLAGFEPTPGGDGIPRPIEEVLTEGFALGVRPLEPFGADSVHLSASVWAARTLGFDPVALPGGLAARSPRLVVHRTLHRRALPRDHWLLVGGLPGEALGGEDNGRLVLAISVEKITGRSR